MSKLDEFFEDAKENGVGVFMASIVLILCIIMGLGVIGCVIGFIGAVYTLTQSVIITIIAAIIIISLVCAMLFSKKESIW